MADPVLTMEGLCKYYTGKQSVVVGLNNISLSFCRGEFVAITGESGSGKSTMAHVLGGILPYETGELLLNGAPTSHYDGTDWERYRRDYVSFISQSYGILPGSTVLGNVVSALRLSGMEKKAASQAAERILKQVELWELRKRRAAKLSSGQKQRLSIARALAKPAPILIADEPTGNLDSENSAKVIELLAQAAKDRLVILITHEFQEAESFATRHIVLQDGRVIMDAALRAPNEPQNPLPNRAGNRRPLSAYVAGLQLSSRPVWAVLMSLFFILTAFAVFSFLGTFIVALDDTPTRIYDSSAFLNGDQRRIVAARADRQAFTQEDFETILSLKYVEALERWGFVADVHYAYQEGQDYQFTYTLQGTGSWDDRTVYSSSAVQLLTGSPFVKTIPMLSGNQEFLSAGRLPENIYEVVAAGPEALIGSTFPVYIQDTKNWAIHNILPMTVTVVGVTDYGSGLYFQEDMGRIFHHLMVNGVGTAVLCMPLYDDPTLEDDECRASAYTTSWFESNRLDYLYLPDMSTYDPDHPEESQDAKLYFDLDEAGQKVSHSVSFNNLLYVTPDTFDRLTWNGGTEQVSITIENYAYTDRVIKALADAGYLCISPYQAGSTEKDPSLEAQRKQTLTVCCAALAAVVFLQIILLRAMFSVETESYRLLSNIGLTSRPAKRSILYQVLAFTLVGQLLGFSGILLCGILGIEKIVYLLRYLPPVYFLILCAVHLAASLVAALWISHAIGRQVYPLAGHSSDLALEAEESEALL